MNQDFQLVSQGENQEVLGPFGRSFIGDFPTKGTLGIIVISILVDAWISGGLLSFLLLSILSIYSAIYSVAQILLGEVKDHVEVLIFNIL